ncbi:MAG: hypothetical protein ACLT98_18515 [Eggerthellaceae bacterium]
MSRRAGTSSTGEAHGRRHLPHRHHRRDYLADILNVTSILGEFVATKRKEA